MNSLKKIYPTIRSLVDHIFVMAVLDRVALS